MTTWKRIESEIAKRLGSERLGNTGKSTPDVMAGGYLVCEIKHRKQLPKWLLGALIQAEVHAEEDQTPVAVLHEAYMPISDCVVLLRLDDFLRLWGA